jgi:hypothetical protein
MINLTRSLTKTQRRKEKKRAAKMQRSQQRKMEKAKYRKERQKSKKNQYDPKLNEPRRKRDFIRNVQR